MELIGAAFLTGLGVLEKHNLLKETGPTAIKNLGLVSALFCWVTENWLSIGGGFADETSYISRVLKVAQENKFEVEGPYDIKKFLSDYEDDGEDEGVMTLEDWRLAVSPINPRYIVMPLTNCYATSVQGLREQTCSTGPEINRWQSL
jgi:hypothetical protein